MVLIQRFIATLDHCYRGTTPRYIQCDERHNNPNEMKMKMIWPRKSARHRHRAQAAKIAKQAFNRRLLHVLYLNRKLIDERRKRDKIRKKKTKYKLCFKLPSLVNVRRLDSHAVNIMLRNHRQLYRAHKRTSYGGVLRRTATSVRLHRPHRLGASRKLRCGPSAFPTGLFHFRRFIHWLMSFLRRCTVVPLASNGYEPLLDDDHRTLPDSGSKFLNVLNACYHQYFVVNRLCYSQVQQLLPLPDLYNRAVVHHTMLPFSICDFDSLVDSYIRPMYTRTCADIRRHLHQQKLFISLTFTTDRVRPPENSALMHDLLAQLELDGAALVKKAHYEWLPSRVLNLIVGTVSENTGSKRFFLLGCICVPEHTSSVDEQRFYSHFITKTFKQFRISQSNVLMTYIDPDPVLHTTVKQLFNAKALIFHSTDHLFDQLSATIGAHYSYAMRLVNNMSQYICHSPEIQNFTSKGASIRCWPAPYNFWEGVCYYEEYYRKIKRFVDNECEKFFNQEANSLGSFHQQHLIRGLQNLFYGDSLRQELGECRQRFAEAIRDANRQFQTLPPMPLGLRAIHRLNAFLCKSIDSDDDDNDENDPKTGGGGRGGVGGDEKKKQTKPKTDNTTSLAEQVYGIFSDSLNSNPGFCTLVEHIVTSVRDGDEVVANSIPYYNYYLHLPIAHLTRQRMFPLFSKLLFDYPEAFPPEYLNLFAICYAHKESWHGDECKTMEKSVPFGVQTLLYQARKAFTEPVPRRTTLHRCMSLYRAELMLNFLHRFNQMYTMRTIVLEDDRRDQLDPLATVKRINIPLLDPSWRQTYRVFNTLAKLMDKVEKQRQQQEQEQEQQQQQNEQQRLPLFVVQNQQYYNSQSFHHSQYFN